jgi:hypothetical protein
LIEALRMGYSTTFTGQVDVVPPLSPEERSYLLKFSRTRRMLRRKGPYFVDGSGFMGQGDDPDVINHNEPPHGQPGLWCQWIPNPEGTGIVWDQNENFYDADKWMLYLIQHFLAPKANAIGLVPGIVGGHILNGEIGAQGEEGGDIWTLVVSNNKVFVREGGLETRIVPAPIMIYLTNPETRRDFDSLFSLKTRLESKIAVIEVDPETGYSPVKIDLYSDLQAQNLYASFLVNPEGKAIRAGTLEWEPE